MRSSGACCACIVLAIAAGGCGDDGTAAGSDAAVGDGSTPGDGSAPGDGGAGDGGLPAECRDRPAEVAPSRGEAHGVLDAEGNRIVLFGGDTEAPEDCMPRYDIVAELWAFELDCHSWTRLEVDGGPGARARVATALDTQRNRMLVFGGRDRVGFGDYENFNDVWAFDLDSDTWNEVETSGEPPSPRSSAAAAYDEENDRLLVFGGNVSTGGLTLTGVGDMYALDLQTGQWSEISAEGAPSERLYHGDVVMDGQWYIFGGTPNFDGPYLNDTYAFDLAEDSWRVVHGGGADAPQRRFGAKLFADGERGRLLMTMGHDDQAMGNRNDVWALDVAEERWSELRPGDELEGEPEGICDFPADFTLPEENAPERRYSFVDVQSDERGYVLFGKTDCGNINDAWAFDFATDGWDSLSIATEGEACNRTGSTTCSSLCS